MSELDTDYLVISDYEVETSDFVYAGLDATLTQEGQAADAKAAGDKIVAIQNTIDTKLAENLTAVNQAMTTKAGEIDSSVNTKLGVVDSKLAENLTAVNQALTTKAGEIDSSVDTKLGAVDTQLAANLTVVNQALTTKAGEIDSSVDTKLGAVDAQLAENLTAVNNKLTEINGIKTEVEEMAEGIEDLITSTSITISLTEDGDIKFVTPDTTTEETT